MGHLMKCSLKCDEPSGEGRDMFFIPGAACGPDVWRPFARRMAERCRAHCVGLAGFAGIAPIEGSLLQAARSELGQRLRECHAPATLFAHSLGCFIAYAVAADVPDHVAALVLVDGPPDLGELMMGEIDKEGRVRVATARAEWIAGLDRGGLAKELERGFAPMVKGHAELGALVRAGAKSDAPTLAAAMHELLTTDLRPLLPSITAPVLAVLPSWPDREELPRVSRIARYQAQLAGLESVEITVVPGTRHFVMLDDPEALAARVVPFLERAGALAPNCAKPRARATRIVSMRIEADKLAAHGLRLELDRDDGARRRVTLAPTRAVTGFFETTPKRFRVAARAAPAVALASLEWEVGSTRIRLPEPAELADVDIDLDIPRADQPPTGELKARAASAEHLEIALASLSEAIRIEKAKLEAVSVRLGDATELSLARLHIGTLALGLGAVELRLSDVAIEGLRSKSGALSLERVTVGEIALSMPDVKEAFGGRKKRSVAPREPIDPGAGVPRDLTLLDRLDGRLDVDLTADTTLPLIGRRKATHHFRIPITGGTIDFKGVESNLSTLEDAVLDFVVKGGQLRLVKDIPLVPFDEKTLVYWDLDADEVELGKRNRVRLRRLAHYRLPEPDEPKSSSGKSALVIRAIHFDGIAVELSLAGPAALALLGGTLRLGSIEQPAIDDLSINGDVRYDARGAQSTTLALESSGWQLGIDGLAIGERRLHVASVKIAKLSDVVLAFEGVRPGALSARAQQIELTAVQLG